VKAGFRVIDADRHVIEPPDFGDRWLEAPYRGRVRPAPERGPFSRYVDGKPAFRQGGSGRGNFMDEPKYRAVFGKAIEDGFGPKSNLEAMDLEGVDVAVHFPSAGLAMIWLDDIDVDLAAAISRGYNNWVADFCGHDPDRLKAVAMVPLHDPEAAARELERAVRQLGLVGAFVPPNPLRGRSLHDCFYDPIYAAAQDLDVPITVHGATGNPLPQVGEGRWTKFGQHVALHPMEQMLASLALLGEGLFDRFPRLRVCHLESSCGWLPFWLERIDDHFESFRYGDGKATGSVRLPSEVFKQQCFISGEAGESGMAHVAQAVSEDILVVATDYPHSDAVDKFPDRTIGDIVDNQSLSREAKRKILWDNPCRLYGLKG